VEEVVVVVVVVVSTKIINQRGIRKEGPVMCWVGVIIFLSNHATHIRIKYQGR